jgi:hypothetical protein
MSSLCVAVDFGGRVEFGEKGFHCDAHDYRFGSQANNPSHMFTSFGIVLSLFFFSVLFLRCLCEAGVMRFNVHHAQMLASSKDSGSQGEADVMMIRSQPMYPVSLDLALVCSAI